MNGVEQVTVVVEGVGDARAHAMGTVAMALEAAGYVVVEGRYSPPAANNYARLLKHGRREAAHSEKRLAVVLAKAAP
jgi:hypothetical protein